MTNLVTYGRNEATIAGRESEVALANFDNGMNLAAASAPGIGICTNVINPKLDDWTVVDQGGNARDPQNTQHIGGNGTATGSETVHPVRAIQGDQNPDGSGGTDNNDTLTFEVAAAQAAPGVGFGPGNTDPINRSNVTIEIGDRAWGVNAVA